jgi:hypothetical protein
MPTPEGNVSAEPPGEEAAAEEEGEGAGFAGVWPAAAPVSDAIANAAAVRLRVLPMQVMPPLPLNVDFHRNA